MRSKWHFSIILHVEFDSAYHKTPGKRTRNKVLPCLIRLTLTLMFWPLTSRKEVKMTPNQKPPLGFGFSTPENPRIRIFSKCIRKLAPQFKKGFFQKYALTRGYMFCASCSKKGPKSSMFYWIESFYYLLCRKGSNLYNIPVLIFIFLTRG